MSDADVIIEEKVTPEKFKTSNADMEKLVEEAEDLIKSISLGHGSGMEIARVIKTNGGDPFLNRGNVSGRDPFVLLNCLCQSFVAIGISAAYNPRPSDDGVINFA